MKVLIIGGTRFIGWHILKELIDANDELVVFNRGQARNILPIGIEHVAGDRKDFVRLRSVVLETKADVLIDCICYDEIDAESCIKAVAGTHTRVIVLSSMDVYKARDVLWRVENCEVLETPLKESSALRVKLFPYRTDGSQVGSWEYSYDKVLVEKFIIAGMNDATILRLPAVYGPDDYRQRVENFVHRMDAGVAGILLGRGEAKWQMTRAYVKDIAYAVRIAVHNEQTLGEIYNLGEGRPDREIDWIRDIAIAADWKGLVLPCDEVLLPKHLKKDFNWEQQWILDTSRFRLDTGFDERQSRLDALSETIQWIRQSSNVENDLSLFAEEEAAFRQIELQNSAHESA